MGKILIKTFKLAQVGVNSCLLLIIQGCTDTYCETKTGDIHTVTWLKVIRYVEVHEFFSNLLHM